MKVNSEINIVMKPKTLFHNYKIIKVNTLIDSYEKFSFATIKVNGIVRWLTKTS